MSSVQLIKHVDQHRLGLRSSAGTQKCTRITLGSSWVKPSAKGMSACSLRFTRSTSTLTTVSLSRSFFFFFEHKWCLHLCCVSVAALMISCHILHYNLLILLGNIIQPQSETCLKRPQNYWSNSSSSTSHLLFFLFFFFYPPTELCICNLQKQNAALHD